MSGPSTADRRRAAAVAGHSGDLDAAAAALDDPSAVVRVAAIRSLARLERLGDNQLAMALGDSDHPVRVAALEIAAHRIDPPIIDLLDDPHPAVVETAAWACGERAGTETGAVARLADLACFHDDALVREAAVAALGAIGDHAGLPAILAAMTDKPPVRRRAVLALAAFEGPDVDAAWKRARADKDRQVRDAVDELLGPTESL